MLQIPVDQRQDYISAVIKEENIRFPGATFAKETGQDSGNISKMLKGELPVSDKFFTAFLQHHPKVPDGWHLENVPLPLGGLKVTLKDHFDLMKEHTEYVKKHASIMERLVEARLLEPGTSNSDDPQRKTQKVRQETQGPRKRKYPEDPVRTSGDKLKVQDHLNEQDSIRVKDK